MALLSSNIELGNISFVILHVFALYRSGWNINSTLVNKYNENGGIWAKITYSTIDSDSSFGLI